MSSFDEYLRKIQDSLADGLVLMAKQSLEYGLNFKRIPRKLKKNNPKLYNTFKINKKRETKIDLEDIKVEWERSTLNPDEGGYTLDLRGLGILISL